MRQTQEGNTEANCITFWKYLYHYGVETTNKTPQQSRATWKCHLVGGGCPAFWCCAEDKEAKLNPLDLTKCGWFLALVESLRNPEALMVGSVIKDSNHVEFQ